jgi:hypothetical protein
LTNSGFICGRGTAVARRFEITSNPPLSKRAVDFFGQLTSKEPKNGKNRLKLHFPQNNGRINGVWLKLYLLVMGFSEFSTQCAT